MPLTLGWQDIALRLFLTFLAGTLIGFNRGEHGHPAGLRTTLLVCLAASVAMIQTNLLLATAGRPSNSFIMLDLMRLPLGILSGMGFIGGGAILKRDNIIKGVTTAATLWYVTVIGLCFGGGQYVLGSAATALGIIVLWSLKFIEMKFPQSRRATLALTVGPAGPTEDDVRGRILAGGFNISSLGVVYEAPERSYEILCEVRWWARPDEARQPDLVKELAQLPDVSRLRWCPQDLQTELS